MNSGPIKEFIKILSNSEIDLNFFTQFFYDNFVLYLESCQGFGRGRFPGFELRDVQFVNVRSGGLRAVRYQCVLVYAFDGAI